MIVKLTWRRAERPVDLEVSVEPATTVGELAEQLLRLDPLESRRPAAEVTLRVRSLANEWVLDPAMPVAGSAVQSGSTVEVISAAASAGPSTRPAAVVEVVSGPDKGASFPLRFGSNYIGRGSGADVALTDETVSKAHAKINVSDVVEVLDNNSSNGIVIGGVRVPRATILGSDLIELGETVVRIRLTGVVPPAVQAAPADPRFVRPPRIAPVFEPIELDPPEFPAVQDRQRLSVVALITPLFVGAGLYAMTRQPATLLFVLMSPMMVLGQWVESRMSARRHLRRDMERFRADLAALEQQARALQEQERASREREHPPGIEVGRAIESRSDLLWCRHPGDEQFLQVRLGTGAVASRVSFGQARGGRRTPELEAALREFIERVTRLDQAPIVADLAESAIGVGGTREAGARVARSVLLQLTGLHAPEDLTVAACLSSEAVDAWEWLKWLPHASSASSPIAVPTVVAGPGGAGQLVSALEELLEERSAGLPRGGDRAFEGAHVVLLVTDDAPVDRGRLVALANRGSRLGVHVIWLSPSRGQLPAACRAFVEVTEDGSAAGFVTEAHEVRPLVADSVDFADVTAWARLMSPTQDAGSLVLDETDLPRSVSFLGLAEAELGTDPAAVAERWRESDSLARHRRAGGGRRKAGTLRALVGQSAAGPLILDLRSDGPHALVGGTTGSGKSELLQTWVLAMAAAHSPERVTFLFVDYKGGSAFGECVRLPHSVGLVTDLSPHLVRRALDSLEAEVRFRERILNRVGAKDLLDMERSGHPDTPPSLVIVVDEFAALVHEVPEFVDGVVNIAQRGRSLGLHLILATQRPAGVIKDNLRANTNLRLALRMADEEDSTDVLGDGSAASFDPTAPGRAALRTGPGRITAFQAAYVGGHTADGAAHREVGIRELSLVEPVAWEAPEEPEAAHADQRTDLQRLLGTITAAAEQEGVAPPRRPWLPELPIVLELADLPSPRDDSELVFARQDEPENQAQPTCAFRPDVDGNLAVYGAGGSGKSAVLRSLAVAAGFTVRGGPVHVYGLDFGARGLQMLEPLPHVGSIIAGEDTERVGRLLRSLRDLVGERADRFAAVNASTIGEYRRHANQPGEPRILLLLDGLAAFRQAHDLGAASGLFELLTSIAADGRPVGVHVVVTADRVATVPSALNSLLPRRLSLRLADDSDLGLLGVPPGILTLQSPPGRGVLDGHEVQVAVLGGDSSSQVQAASIARFARAMRKNTTWQPAPEVRRLPVDLRWSDVPDRIGTKPVLGLADEDLAPATFVPEGTFVVAGPPGSGRTTALRTVVRAALAVQPSQLAVFTPARRPAIPVPDIANVVVACGHDDVAEAAAKLHEQLSADPEDSTRWVIVLEAPGEFLNGPADLALQDLLKVARSAGHFVVAEGETSTMSGTWPLLQAVRFSRRGLALQPDQTDGDMVFKTSFPRLRRSEFVPGRGILVADGRAKRVQVAWSGGLS